MSKLTKKHRIYIGVIGAIILAIIIGLFMLNSNDSKLQEQLDLGQKYMEDCNYEQAIVAFNKAIEIDDRSVEAYIGLAETYIRMSEFDNALEIACKGYEITGDERLLEYIAMIEDGNISRSDGLIMKTTHYDDSGVVMYSHEFAYDNKKRQSSISHYDANHNYVSSVEILYNENGNVLTTYSYLTSTGDLTKYEINYENGLMVSKISCEEEPHWDLYEYDENGNQYKTTRGYGKEIGKEENIIATDINQYDEMNRWIRMDSYNNLNELAYSQTYEYNENGDRIKYSQYDSDGSLDWYELYEDGAMYKYDGDGNLLYYTVSE